MKNFIIVVLFLIFIPWGAVVATETTPGADLYLQALAAVNKKDFSLAKAKLEEAAQYLTGQNQTDALRLADFFSKMSPKVTEKILLKESNIFTVLGEVKEAGRVWHFYKSDQASLLHLAIAGKKPLDELVSAIGSDQFTQTNVIANAQGYLSKPNLSMPNSASRIRLWYCDKDDTTNIVYETTAYNKDYEIWLNEIDLTFSNVKCGGQIPVQVWLAVISLVILLVLVFIIYKIFKRPKVSLK